MKSARLVHSHSYLENYSRRNDRELEVVRVRDMEHYILVPVRHGPHHDHDPHSALLEHSLGGR